MNDGVDWIVATYPLNGDTWPMLQRLMEHETKFNCRFKAALVITGLLGKRDAIICTSEVKDIDKIREEFRRMF